MPPIGQNVIVLLEDGAETLAYFMDGLWWVGQEDNPNDIPLTLAVQSWRWPEA